MRIKIVHALGAFLLENVYVSDGVEVQFMNCAAATQKRTIFCIGSLRSYNGTCTTVCPVGTVANASKHVLLLRAFL